MTSYGRSNGERRRLSRQASHVLELFQERGTLTNAELAEVAQRFGARIKELREAGHQITLVAHDRDTGETTYRYDGYDAAASQPPRPTDKERIALACRRGLQALDVADTDRVRRKLESALAIAEGRKPWKER